MKLRNKVMIFWIVGITTIAQLSAGAAPSSFVPQDIEVCPASANVLDPEFDSKSQLMTFMNALKQVRVTSVLPDGTVGSLGCTGMLIDQGIWGFPDKAGGYNGPEWGRSQRGLEIFYLKPMADGKTPSLWRASPNGSGWQPEPLASGDRRTTLLASTDDTDLQARLLYLFKPTQQFIPMWRESTDPSTEAVYPAEFTQSTGGSPRWIPGQRALSLTKTDAAGVRQAARYFIDTKTTEILTNDSGNKDEVWMWSAPEFGGDLVFTTVVDGCCLRVYRQMGSAWTLIKALDPKSFTSLKLIFSPEPRVVKGHSYVALQVGNGLKDPSEIWLTSIDPSFPVLRQISTPGVSAVRTEPEWLLTPNGAFVYYSVTTGKGVSLRRAATGAQSQ